MKRFTSRLWWFGGACAALLLAGACSSNGKATSGPDMAKQPVEEKLQPVVDDGIPRVDREFRAVWVATVANIDWPSTAGLSTQEQQDEAIAILDRCKELGLNAVVFQVRPHCDALYASELEPWSYYLTGEQGKAPDPYYDPLTFWVDESHKRGMELHVWFNPYRAHHTASKGELADSNLIKSRPGLAKELANGMWWLDPAKPEVQDHSLAVMLDVVRRYDIDGVHMDDYFYPYPSYNDGKDFPDDDTWEAYLAAGGTLSRGDWRRKAVDDFVERLYKGVKETKAHVKVGLSPFGIWRPNNPPSIKGFDQYDQLYADAKLWLNKGWVDYYTPQLYWPTNQIPQSFPVLLSWWRTQNTEGRNLWPGLGTYRINEEDTGATTVDEIFNQIMFTRAIVPEGPGQVHFSMKHFMRNVAGVSDTLANGPYARPAIVPASPWLDSDPPAQPMASAAVSGENLVVSWQPKVEGDVFVWVLAVEQGGAWRHIVLPAQERSTEIQVSGTVSRTVTSNQGTDVEEVEEPAKPVSRVAVFAVDRTGNESKPALAVVAQ